MTQPGYPFSALVGQQLMKLGLILAAVQPRIGGILLRGEKGTAKSTAVRALADLLPQGVPLRTLPLGATEDRVAGGLDLEKTIAEGRPILAPGLLAMVDGGVLYVDEVNLLDDHLVDLVLDAASSGMNRVEREGLSLTHPARFALVGSMNPEEGALRPQLLDRFGLCVDVVAEADVSERVALMQRRTAFDADAQAFSDAWSEAEADLRQAVRRARELVDSVVVDSALRHNISQLTTAAHVAGHRADLVVEEAAKAHAAWNGRGHANLSDVLAVLELALAHRRRDTVPPDEVPNPPQPETEQTEDSAGPEPTSEDSEESQDEQPDPPEASQDGGNPEDGQDLKSGLMGPDGGAVDFDASDDEPQPGPAGNLPTQLPTDPFRVKTLPTVQDHLARKGSGRRQRTRSADRRGRYVRARAAADTSDLALDATLRAAAVHQRVRRWTWSQTHGDAPAPAIIIDSGDYHRKVRERKVGSCIVFVVDASGSMGARGRMAASKGAILSLLLDAYAKRDKVALIAFRREGAEVLLPPTSSIEVASRLLAEMPIGGRTPLAAGLVASHDLCQPLLYREPLLRPMVILISDGRANQALEAGLAPMPEALELAGKLADDDRIQWVIVDTEDTTNLRLGMAKRIAEALRAPAFTIDDLKAEDLVSLVKGQQH